MADKKSAKDEKTSRSGLTGDVKELVDMLKAYARQETLGPFRDVGRFIAMGVAGSVFLAIGALLMLLAGLRALQTETGSWFTGSLSWIPYFIMMFAGILVMALSARAIVKSSGGNA